MKHVSILQQWHGWFLPFFLICAALVFANVIHWIVFRVVRRKQEEETAQTPSLRTGLGLQKHLGRPARMIFLITCFFFVEPFLPFERSIHRDIREWLAMLLIIGIGWFAVGAVYVVQNALYRKYDLSAQNNVDARRFRTQFQLLRRVLIIFIVVLTIAGLAYTSQDDRLWRAGTGLLASAGLASLVLAGAAKSTVGNFLAGLQIALTQPIRIDDVVVVAGEWGRIEEITAAYVVVKIWDQRRLIVPLSWWIENSFTNWTRESAEILGTAFLYLDYAVPVEPLRAHLEQIARESPLWDGRVVGLQVTDLRERVMELRCLVSSADASKSFDLRCLVREKMMDFVRQNYPEAFPTARIASRPQNGDVAALLPSQASSLGDERRRDG